MAQFTEMCATAIKNKDYSQVIEFYNMVQSNIHKVLVLMQSGRDTDITKPLEALKTGLISKSQDVAISCCKTLTRIISKSNFEDMTWLVSSLLKAVRKHKEAFLDSLKHFLTQTQITIVRQDCASTLEYLELMLDL